MESACIACTSFLWQGAGVSGRVCGAKRSAPFQVGGVRNIGGGSGAFRLRLNGTLPRVGLWGRRRATVYEVTRRARCPDFPITAFQWAGPDLTVTPRTAIALLFSALDAKFAVC